MLNLTYVLNSLCDGLKNFLCVTIHYLFTSPWLLYFVAYFKCYLLAVLLCAARFNILKGLLLMFNRNNLYNSDYSSKLAP